MNDMNLETPIRTTDSDTLVIVDHGARRRKRIAIVGAALVAAGAPGGLGAPGQPGDPGRPADGHGLSE